MDQLAIATDLGTSGFRAQAINLKTGCVIATAVTARHPIPGNNVIDHLHFALETGTSTTAQIIIQSINQIIKALNIPVNHVNRFAVCGNPVQLSLFQGFDIRDLAYSGKNKLDALKISPPDRSAKILSAQQLLGLDLPKSCEIIIPPSVCHEIGADALAMIIQTGINHLDETAIITDYGTNAEMALCCNGRIYTGSTAAGPALEGQHITCGKLAMPGVITDINFTGQKYNTILLDSEMFPISGDAIDLCNTTISISSCIIKPTGITGTGVIALIHEAMATGLISLPHILTMDRQLHMGQNFFFTEKDLKESGKAIGSIRAGHITLCQKAGISLDEIRTAYLAGASGTYVDAKKAQQLGLVPPCASTIYQAGNTSLAMAKDLALDPEKLNIMTEMANQLKHDHCVFAASDVFKKLFILELSFWTEGMPVSLYRSFLKKYGLPDLPPVTISPEIIHIVNRDITDLGSSCLKIISDIGRITKIEISDCTGCLKCIDMCPREALSFTYENGAAFLTLVESVCDGVTCKQCENSCPEKILHFNSFFSTEKEDIN